MSTFTTNFHLEKPETGAQTGWDEAWRDAMDTIDTTLKDHADDLATAATLPIAQSDVTGLTAALAGKAPTVHTHAESDVTNLVSDLAGKAPTVHNHAASDINSGQVALARGGTGVDLSAGGGTTKILAQDASHIISARDLVAADIPNHDANKITTGLLAMARGGLGVDLSASGGATKIVAQDASHVFSARDLVAADIPNLDAAKIATGVLASARGGVPTLSTADQSFMISNGIIQPSGAGGNPAVVANGQEVRAILFICPVTITITKISINVAAAGAGGSTVTVGYYSADRATKLIDSGTFNGASATIQTLTISSVTLFAGQAYWFVQSASTQTTLTVVQAYTPNSNLITLLNGQTAKKYGLAANAASAGVLPSSLGAITGLIFNPIAAVCEP